MYLSETNGLTDTQKLSVNIRIIENIVDFMSFNIIHFESLFEGFPYIDWEHWKPRPPYLHKMKSTGGTFSLGKVKLRLERPCRVKIKIVQGLAVIFFLKIMVWGGERVTVVANLGQAPNFSNHHILFSQFHQVYVYIYVNMIKAPS